MNSFLVNAGWGDAEHHPLQGDASTRRYTRLRMNGQTAMLMQDPDGDVSLFARLSRHLKSLGLSAPEIYAEDPEAGLLLIEDFGDSLIAKLAIDDHTERALYLTATDALIELHRHEPPSDLPVADARTLANMTDLAFVHYADQKHVAAKVAAAFQPILEAHATPTDVMILRDYHAENILDLDTRDGPARAGLLDFQDALQGHRAYDLISLLEDARRDLFPGTKVACISHYITTTGLNSDQFNTSLSVLGAQRNLRILGVFARLAKTRGKPGYIDLIPRVWGHLKNDLKHPALAHVAPLILDALPEPTGDHLERLKTACPKQ